MEIIHKEMLISQLTTNQDDPRYWSWKYPHIKDDDILTLSEDRFICTDERYPYTKIKYLEGIRAKTFEKAVRRVEERDWHEIGQFRDIIIDESGYVISGTRILQIHKAAGMNSVEVVQVLGMTKGEKIEMMCEDCENFQQYNWTPKLPRLKHAKVSNFEHN